MAYVAVNRDGSETISEELPQRFKNSWKHREEHIQGTEYFYVNLTFSLPEGSIRKLIDRELTWLDNPVELW